MARSAEETKEISSSCIIFPKKSGITNADTLWERARRTKKGRELGVTKKHAETYLKGEGRSEVYKEVAQQWPGAISRPVEPDKVFDMDSIELSRISTDDPAQEGKKHILVLLDRFRGVSTPRLRPPGR